MKIGTAVLAVLSAASVYGAEGFGVPRTFAAQRSSLTSLAMSTKEKEGTDSKKKEAPPVNIGWDSHKAVVRVVISEQERAMCCRLGLMKKNFGRINCAIAIKS
jgi:hypothetical protein